MANCDDSLYARICDESPEISFKFDEERKEHKTHRFSGSEELLEYIGERYMRLSSDPMDDDSDKLFECLRREILSNVEIPFCKILCEASLTDLAPKVWAAFIEAVCETITKGTNVFSLSSYDQINIKVLKDLGIIQDARTYEQNGEYLTEESGYLFTPHWFRKLFSDVALVERDTLLRKYSTYMGCTEIRPMELFYPEQTVKEISRMTRMLMPDKFEMVSERLHSEKFSTGILGILYGAPGAGKTEAVYQIARQTGRDLYLVSPSNIQATFMGESEKRVTDLFASYEYCSSIMEKHPILFFNEADGILTKRFENPERAADVSQNAIQTIILQAMEKIQGIVLMTTNILLNLDDAMFRRVTVKIETPIPDAQTREKIWAKRIPELPQEWIAELSASYPFTGGNIANVAKNLLIDQCLDENSFTLSHIREICDMEQVGRREKPRKRIGF